MSALISVIVPCYNQSRFLDDCLASVYNQTFTNWECIIVNDGSPDNTEQIAKRWVEKDSRFKYVYKINGGLSSARNAGLKIAGGEFIQFLDCDDTIHTLKFEKQIDCFSDLVDIVVSDYFPFDDENGLFLSRRYVTPFLNTQRKIEIVTKWETHVSIPCHTVLFKKSLLERADNLRFDESLPNHEDWVFWSTLFYFSNDFFNLRIALANYRIQKSSLCHDTNSMNLGFIKAVDLLILFFRKINAIDWERAAQYKKHIISGQSSETAQVAIKQGRFKKYVSLLIPPLVSMVYSRLRRFIGRWLVLH